MTIRLQRSAAPECWQQPEEAKLLDFGYPGPRTAWRPLAVWSLCVALLGAAVVLGSRAPAVWTDSLLAAYGVGVLVVMLFTMAVAFGVYRDPGLRPRPPEYSPLVSFLVAVHNDERVIVRCVESLLASTYEPKEVIVVDDASTDGTVRILRELAVVRNFTLIELTTNVGKKRALVKAIESAQGEILAFTDSDSVVAPDALERCVSAFAHDRALGAISGHGRALNRDQNLLTKIQDVWYDGQFGIAKAAESAFGSVTCVSGPLAVFRREAIFNYLPAWANDAFLGREFRFATDRQLTGYVLGQRWLDKGQYTTDPLGSQVNYLPQRWKVAYSRSARVLTVVPGNVQSFYRQQARWKKSFIRNLFFTGKFVWRRGVVTTSLYYSHVLFVVCAPVMAFRHLVWLPTHGEWELCLLYLAGVFFKGWVWSAAYWAQNPGCGRWVFRPAMSIISALTLSWLIIYSALTIRRAVWFRG